MPETGCSRPEACEKHYVSKSKKPRKNRLPVHSKPRNAALDTLRGLAILLMIVDHIAYFILDIPIALDTLRIGTRLSMPLFCGLMGYFLAQKETIHWNRLYQLLLAAFAMNLVFFTIYRKFEILASLSICYALYLLCGRKMALLVVAVFFVGLDPTARWFDYPLPIVLSCVAQGMVIRLYDWPVSLAAGVLVTCGIALAQPPAEYVLYFVLPSTLLIGWAARHPSWRFRPLAWIGRYPLTIYLAQYFIILAIGRQT